MNFDLPEGWTVKTLSECCTETISYGIVQPGKHDDNGVPVVRVNNFSRDGLELNEVLKVSPDISAKFKRTVLRGGEVLLTLVGSTGQSIVVPESMKGWNVPRAIAVIRVASEVGADWVNICLQSPATKYFLDSRANTTVQKTLNLKDVKEIPILLPPDEYKNTALSTLISLNEKLALNTQTNQTLEEMAQAIFKSWFVDFDPVKAKMNGEQPEGMDAATASLFPEKLVESELGLIPEGWEVGTLDSHTSMIIDHRGKTPKKLGSDWVEEGYPAISAKNIKSKKIVRPDTIRFIDEATYKKWMKEPLIKGDIIMTSEAPMGELYFFDGSEDFCLSQRLYGLRANSDVCSPEFLFNWLQTTKAKADMEGRASGTTALGIKQAELRKVKILTPPLELLEKYSAVASNLVDMAAKNNAQNTVLEDLRDTLLPKLLSGEIELGQTQELIEVE